MRILKKFGSYLVCLGFVLSFFQASSHLQADQSFVEDSGKRLRLHKIVREWFKAKKEEAKIQLDRCLEGASTKEERKICKATYREKIRELRKYIREAKQALKSCLAAAIDKEARRACKAAFIQKFK